jgi:TRAP-type uncharacterized transport system substrate-binding protein
MTFCTGASSGTKYIVGAAQAGVLNKYCSDLATFNVEGGSTAIENVTYVNSSADYMGLSPLDFAWGTYTANEEMGFKEKFTDLRLLQVGYSSSVHFVVNATAISMILETSRGSPWSCSPAAPATTSVSVAS